jgi:hypothetical protein
MTTMPIYVTAVDYIADYNLVVTFTDGCVKTVDCSGLINKGPVYQPWQDVAYFKQFVLDPEAETLVWPNGADIAPSLLYAMGQLVTAECAN